eukprot:m.173364 g.173364  ORF g.173364 m.173364 type:complete len:892 (-) comp15305_c0_seq1:324-2999(-)
MSYKAHFGADIRRFFLAPNTFAGLQERLISLFRLREPHITWRDVDGDVVTIACEEDLAAACAAAGGSGQTLRIFVSDREPTAAAGREEGRDLLLSLSDVVVVSGEALVSPSSTGQGGRGSERVRAPPPSTRSLASPASGAGLGAQSPLDDVFGPAGELVVGASAHDAAAAAAAVADPQEANPPPATPATPISPRHVGPGRAVLPELPTIAEHAAAVMVARHEGEASPHPAPQPSPSPAVQVPVRLGGRAGAEVFVLPPLAEDDAGHEEGVGGQQANGLAVNGGIIGGTVDGAGAPAPNTPAAASLSPAPVPAPARDVADPAPTTQITPAPAPVPVAHAPAPTPTPRPAPAPPAGAEPARAGRSPGAGLRTAPPPPGVPGHAHSHSSGHAGITAAAAGPGIQHSSSTPVGASPAAPSSRPSSMSLATHPLTGTTHASAQTFSSVPVSALPSLSPSSTAASLTATATVPRTASIGSAPPAPPGPAPVVHRPAPAPPPGAAEKRELADYKENLQTHTKGIFRKKVSIESLLSWSREPISKPMLLTIDKRLRKDAVELFRLVLGFMGDRPIKGREPNQLALEIVTRCWDLTSGPALRDEIYIQLCKQTYMNRNLPSCEAGWVLLFICLNFFPPSQKFNSYLQGYISRNIGSGQLGLINTYAESCLKRLERVQQTGAKRGSKNPTIEEVNHAQASIIRPPVFGSSLEEVMESQQEKHPNARVPLVIKTLAQAILDHNGPQTEGLFRVPGDIDSVNTLKLALNQNNPLPPLSDPHVPGSALKLWFRELPHPLIGHDLYEECLASFDNPAAAIATVSRLPTANYNTLLFIIHFLQLIGRPENQKITKMTMDNLAMVWAPNFLRCLSSDPMIIFTNARKEMSFVRVLLLNWDTSSAETL